MLLPPPARRSHDMPAALMRMPLRTSQAAPHFCGAPDDLPCYLEEVQGLCWSCQCAADADLIKYAVYYANESSWNTFAAVRDTLDDPKTWDGFIKAICDMYPLRQNAHTSLPLQAPLPPLSMPQHASLPLLLPVPCALLPAPAVLLVPDARPAPLSSCALSMLPSVASAKPLPFRALPRFPAEQRPLLPKPIVLLPSPAATLMAAVLPPLPMPVPCAQSLLNAAFPALLPVPVPHAPVPLPCQAPSRP